VSTGGDQIPKTEYLGGKDMSTPTLMEEVSGYLNGSEDRRGSLNRVKHVSKPHAVQRNP